MCLGSKAYRKSHSRTPVDPYYHEHIENKHGRIVTTTSAHQQASTNHCYSQSLSIQSGPCHLHSNFPRRCNAWVNDDAFSSDVKCEEATTSATQKRAACFFQSSLLSFFLDSEPPSLHRQRATCLCWCWCRRWCCCFCYSTHLFCHPTTSADPLGPVSYSHCFPAIASRACHNRNFKSDWTSFPSCVFLFLFGVYAGTIVSSEIHT